MPAPSIGWVWPAFRAIVLLGGLDLRTFLIPCDVLGRTVWIVYPTAQTGAWFAILNAATTNFDHPFGMYLPAQETARGGDELQMELRRLQFEDETDPLPGKQLWGVAPGFQG